MATVIVGIRVWIRVCVSDQVRGSTVSGLDYFRVSDGSAKPRCGGRVGAVQLYVCVYVCADGWLFRSP